MSLGSLNHRRDIQKDSPHTFVQLDEDPRRVCDTVLIERIRTILSNTQYVYDTVKHTDEVFKAMQEINELIETHSSSICTTCTLEGNTAMHIACGTVTPHPDHINPAALANKNSYKRNFRVRNDIVKALLRVGANPFLLNNLNQTSIEVAPEGAYRESLITLLLEYRSSTEGAILSVPPLDASRLMKRANDHNGYAIFSNVCKNCIYYLYKGAIYLWDIKDDTEHVVYQPRTQDSKINTLETQYSTFERKKSIVTKAGAAGSGKWTSKAQTTPTKVSSLSANLEEEVFDPSEGNRILNSISFLETKIQMVRNFIVVTGASDTSCAVDDEGSEGVYEWVICDIGVAIGVRLGSDGVRIRLASSFVHPRRQSHVCGERAQYPKNHTIDNIVLYGCAIRFSRKSNVGNVTCAIDGLQRKFAYIVAKKSDQFNKSDTDSRRSSVTVNMLNTSFESHSIPFNRVTLMESDTILQQSLNSKESRLKCRPSVSFSISEALDSSYNQLIMQDTNNHKATDLLEDESMISTFSSCPFKESGEDKYCPSPICDKIFTTDDQTIFRVGRIKPLRNPNESIGDTFFDLSNNFSSNTFERSMDYMEYKIPTVYGDAVFVGQCSLNMFLLCCVNGVVVADLTEVFDKPTVVFHDISKYIRPQGPIRGGVTSGPQHHRNIGSGSEKCHFVVLSEIVEIFLLVRDNVGGVIVTPLFRNMNDSVVPHMFTSFFRGNHDEIVIAYQSLKKTELCVFNLNTYSIESLCKLPKPSSLRFYPPKAPGSSQGEATVADLPSFIFAVSTDGNYLIRYNVTMHVMSIYSWDEVIQRSRAKKIPIVSSVFSRKPKMVEQCINLASHQRSLTRRDSRNIYDSPTENEKIPCTWLVMECDMLQKLTKRHNLLERDQISKNSLCTYINTVISDTFLKITIGHSGKPRHYVPPVFTYSHSEDEMRTQEEITEMAEIYYGSRPMYEGVWCSIFDDTIDAIRCAIALLRELNRSDKLKEEVLVLHGADNVRRDSNRAVNNNNITYLNNVPEVRCLIFEGDTTSTITDFIVTHRLSTDVSNNVMERPIFASNTTPIKKNGVIIVPTNLLVRIKPLLPLTDDLKPECVTLPVHRKSSCYCNSPPVSPGNSNTAVGGLTPEIALSLIVPQEIHR